MSKDPSPAVFDDRQLVELASTPAERLFPVLDRSAALAPLLILLAVLPSLYALQSRTLTGVDAAWGLVALRLSTVTETVAFLDPATGQPADAAPSERTPAYRPPLSTWLTAAVMRWSGSTRPWTLVVHSVAATAGLVILTFYWSREMFGNRVAWWATALLACHGPFLLFSQSAVPVALTTFLAVVALWGYATHRRRTSGVFSGPLVTGGIGLGLCVLAGGPVAVTVVLVLLVHVSMLRGETTRARKTADEPPRKIWIGRSALKSLGVMTLIGLVVGGWWEAWMWSRHSSEFLSGWLLGSRRTITATGSVSTADVLWSFVQSLGVLTPLFLFAAASAVRSLIPSDPADDSRSESKPVARGASNLQTDRERRPAMTLLCAWAGVALVTWIIFRIGPHRPRYDVALWQGLFLVPAVVLCGHGLEFIARRRLSTIAVAGLLTATVLLMFLEPPVRGFGALPSGPGPRRLEQSSTSSLYSFPSTVRNDPARRELLPSLLRFLRQSNTAFVVWLTLLAAGVVTAAGWRLSRYLNNRDERHRFVLTVAVIAWVVTNAAIGLAGIRRRTAEDTALIALRQDLARLEGIARLALLANPEVPLPLEYIVTSVWPYIRPAHLTSWGELSQVLNELPRNERRLLVVEWHEHSPTRLRISGVRTENVGPPRFLWKSRLRVYFVTKE